MSVAPGRLAVVTTSYPSDASDPTGHFVLEDVLAHRRAGYQVTVLAPYDARRIDVDVIQLRHAKLFGWPGMVSRLRENPARAVGAPRWLHAVHTELRRLRPDAVEVHWACPNALAVPRGMTTHLVSHGSDVRLLARVPRAMSMRIMRDAVSWRFVAKHLRDQVRARLSGEARARFDAIAHVTPSALGKVQVAPELRNELRAKHMLPLFVVVARLIPTKEVRRAIVHFKSMNAGGTLVIVGDGPERAALEQLARGSHVHFAGMLAHQETLHWIAAADELWMSSRSEGASTVAREAQALGTPVRWL